MRAERGLKPVPTYGFRPVVPADLAMLNAWRREPHVAEWWGDDPFYREADLAEPRVAMRIVEADGVPFAFVQDYDVHGWEGHHFAHLPTGSRGMDQFIGSPSMIGRGHGPAFIALAVDELFAAGAPAVAVDPHPDNARAIAAYGKAGFVIAGKARETRWGTVLPMEAWRPSR